MKKMMTVYHRTTEEVAKKILAHGFQDDRGSYFTDKEFAGVWLSDIPLDGNSGANGDALFTMEIPAKLFKKYEWVEEGKAYRESLIPSAELNCFGPPKLILPYQP